MNHRATTPDGSAPRRILPDFLREWLPETVLLLVTTGAGIWAAGRWLNPFDDPGYAWSLAYRLAHGEKLYRDIYTHFAPLSPYVLAAGAKVFGATPRYFLLAYWIPAIVAALLLLRCGRVLLSTFERLILVGLIIATSLFAPGPGHLVSPYYAGMVHALLLSVAALLLVRPNAEIQAKRVFLAGGFAGLAFSCKQEVGLAILAALTVTLAIGLARTGSFAALLAGFLTVLLPVMIFVLTAAPYESLLHDSRFWPLAAPPSTTIYFLHEMSGLARHHWPLAVAKRIFLDIGMLAAIAAICLLASHQRERKLWTHVAVLLAGGGLGWLALAKTRIPAVRSLSLATLVALLLAVTAIFLKDCPNRAFVAGLSTFAALVGLRTIFSTDVGGYYGGPAQFASALTSLIALLALAPRLILDKTRAAVYLRTVLATGLFCLSWWHAAVAIRVLRNPASLSAETPAGRVFLPRKEHDLLVAIAKYSAPGERVLVISEAYAIDALFHLRSVSPLPWASPGWLDERIETRLLRKFEDSPPDLIVLLTRPYKEFGSQPFGVGYGRALSDWCFRHYRVVASLPKGQVLRRG